MQSSDTSARGATFILLVLLVTADGRKLWRYASRALGLISYGWMVEAGSPQTVTYNHCLHYKLN